MKMAEGVEALLAQKLVSNEKRARDRAMRSVRRYITARETHGFSADDLLKIWKGLFYCLWMQDKPLLQEELSSRIAGLIHSFNTIHHQLLFFETFLLTVRREWNGIDRLRMDKFYQLVRFVFRQMFEMMKRRQWDCSVVKSFLEVLTAQLLQSSAGVPKGLLLHILDLYMTELAQVGSAELGAEQSLTFIDPFCKTMAKCKDRSLLVALCKHIFSSIVDQAPYAVEDLMKELQRGEGGSDSDSGQASEEEDEMKNFTSHKAKGKKLIKGEEDNEEEDDEKTSVTEEEEDEGIGPVLQFDYGALAERLFELGSRGNIPSVNRNKIYRLVKIFRDLSEGILPQEGGGGDDDGDDDDDDDVAASSDEELFDDDDDKKKKKKKKGTEEEEEEHPARKDAVEDVIGDAEQSCKKKKRRRRKVKRDGGEQKAGESEAFHTSEESPESSVQPEGPEHTEVSSEVSRGTVSKRRRKGRTHQSEVEEGGASEQQLIPPSEEGATEEVKHLSEAQDDTHTTAPPVCRRKKKALLRGVRKESEQEDRQTDRALDKNRKNKKLSKKGVNGGEQTEGDTWSADGQKDDMGLDVSAAHVNHAEEQDTGAAKKERKKSKKQRAKEVSGEEEEVTSSCVEESGCDVMLEDPTVMKKKKKPKKKKCVLEEQDAETLTHTAERKSQKKRSAWGLTTGDEEDAQSSNPQQKKSKKQERDEGEGDTLVETHTDPVALRKRMKKKKLRAEAELDAAVTELENTQLSTERTSKKKKRKMKREEEEQPHINGHVDEAGGKKTKTSMTPVKKVKKVSAESDFISFQTQSKTPTPLFYRAKHTKQPSTPLSSVKTFQTPKSESKKVTFGLKNNKTAEFRQTDQSSLLSPVGSSRVAFDPEKKPVSGVLKSPSVKKAAAPRRPTASDFF